MAEQHNTNKLLSLARECGGFIQKASTVRCKGIVYEHEASVQLTHSQLSDLESRIRQDERERCAVICDGLHDRQINSMCSHNYHRFAAAAIRSGASHG